MLVLELELLTGRLVATSASSRRESEWPPHPARLFSALVDAWASAETPSEAEGEVLDLIAAAAPPAIEASPASERELVTVFVPVNDLSVVDDCGKQETAVRDAAEAVEAAAAEGPKALVKAQKELAKREQALRDARAKARLAAGDSEKNVKRAGNLLPHARTARQPRTFPSMSPDVPVLRYGWPDLALTATQLGLLDGLLARVVRLGHSSSLVAARIGATIEPTLVPTADGEIVLRAMLPAQRSLLVAAHGRHKALEPRVMPATFVRYAAPEPPVEAAAAASSFGEDWLILRRVGGVRLPMTATAGVAQQVRRALLRFAAEPIPPVLSGHSADGAPLDRAHLAIVPLPFIGHEQATGMLVGIALVMPRDVDETERTAVFRAVAAWEQSIREADPEQAVDTPQLPLHLGPAGVLVLERSEWGNLPAALRARAWVGPARAWRTATPIALDRNPGQLRSRDPRQLAEATAAATAMIARSCQHLGLPAPIAIELWPASPIAGAAKARAYPAFPGTGKSPDRVLTHARLVFAEPVRGPVLLGAGRYRGLGLCRPEAVDA